jgi:NTE family protein
VYLKYNSLNQIFYPTKGVRINAEFAQVYDQKPSLRQFQNGVEVVPPGLNFENYSRFVFDGSLFASFNSKFAYFSELQAGLNFTSQPNVLNNFLIGGISGSFRNQVRFAGLQEATVNSSSVVSLQMGLRYNPINNIYFIGRINGLFKDLLTRNNNTSGNNALTGYALTFAYRTPIGPLELSAMYSDQSKKLQSYVLFGISFCFILVQCFAE